MLYIPPTTKKTYLSLMPALNIISDGATGDWHSIEHFRRTHILPDELLLMGDNQALSTNDLLGEMGIYNATPILKKMGYTFENSPVYAADHYRACFDLLYFNCHHGAPVNSVIMDEWFPVEEDQEKLYHLIELAFPKLSEKEKAYFNLWKSRNKIGEDYY